MKLIDNKVGQDNWKKYDYTKKRFLDTLASIYSIQPPCPAAFTYNQASKVSQLSYNANLFSHHKIIFEKINNALSEKNFETLLSLYLCFNVNFRPTLDVYVNKIPSGKTSEMKKFCGEIRALCKDLKLAQTNFQNNLNIDFLDKDLNKFFISYSKILTNIQENKSALSDTLKHIPQDCILRPWQDITKILKYSSQNDHLNITEDCLLENNELKHAELNIKNLSKNDYVGVSTGLSAT